MFHLRPAYVPPLMNLAHGGARVGAEAPAVHQAAPQPIASDGARTALYVGVPALGLGALAYFMAWTTPVVLLAAAGGGLGGFIASTLSHGKAPPPPPSPALPAGKKDTCLADLDAETRGPVEEAIKKNDGVALAAYAKQARDHGWECAAKEIEERAKAIASSADEHKAKLDITLVAAEAGEPLGKQVTDVLGMFTVAITGGSELDYKSALFPVRPTTEQLKMITDLADALGSSGYAKARQQALDVADAAKAMRAEAWTSISRVEAMKLPGAAADFGFFADPTDSSKTLLPDDPMIDALVSSVLAVNDTAAVFAKSAGAVGPAVVKIVEISGSDYRGIVLNPSSFSGILPAKIVASLASGPTSGSELRFTAGDVVAVKPV